VQLQHPIDRLDHPVMPRRVCQVRWHPKSFIVSPELAPELARNLPNYDTNRCIEPPVE
jgi:hypothetical protein